MENEFSKLTENVLTKEDLISLLEEIYFVENLIFKEKERKLSEKIEGKVSPNLENFVKELEKREKLKNLKEAENIFENLKEYLLSLPQIKLKIAFNPRRDFQERIAKVFDKKLILDFEVDPEIIGGVIVEYGGKIFDFSLKRNLERILKEEFYERV